MEKVTLNRRKSSPTARGGSQEEEKTPKCSKRVKGNSIKSDGCDGGIWAGIRFARGENSGNGDYARDGERFGVSRTQKLEEHR